MMLNIVFQNENFIICDKPAEVLSVPARDTNDARLCLGLELQNKLKQQIFPVHRLDFEVSGLIMYALNKQSHRQSQKWFENKKIQKKYIAKTSRQDFKHWPPELKNDRQVLELHLDIPFYWRTQIMRGKRRAFETENGDWAETKALLFNLGEENLDWILFPLTGKPHQLRFELSHRGFPICGDRLYGSDTEWVKPGIALRAIEFDFRSVNDRLGLPEKIQIQGWSK